MQNTNANVVLYIHNSDVIIFYIMFHLLNCIIFFFIILLPLTLSISNSTERRNAVAHKNEDIFGNTFPRPAPSLSKIDTYVYEWVRKILEMNETGSFVDVMSSRSIPPVSKDYYYINLKLIIKKYCFNTSSEEFCIQVVLKPHMNEETPLHFRLFRKGINSDSTIKHLDEKEFLNGYDARKYKKRHHKDDKNVKSLNAFDQFYKYLSKRKKKLLHYHNNSRNFTFIEKFTEHDSIDALVEPFIKDAPENPNRTLAYKTNMVKEAVEKRTSSSLESFEYGPAIELSEERIMYEPPEIEYGRMGNGVDVSKPERKQEKKEESEIKKRSKRADKKKKKKKKKADDTTSDTKPTDSKETTGTKPTTNKQTTGTKATTNEKTTATKAKSTKKSIATKPTKHKKTIATKPTKHKKTIATTPEEDYDEPEEEDGDEDEKVEEVDGDDDVADDEEVDADDEGGDDEEGDADEEEDDDDNEEEGEYDDEEEEEDEEHELDSSADDSGEYEEGDYNPGTHHPSVHGANAHAPGFHDTGAYVPLEYAYDIGGGDVGPQVPAQPDPGVISDYPQDWNRCQLPGPRKTSEVLCKVLPRQMICQLFCIHGHTFPEGTIRKTFCDLNRGVWSMKFDECLPFVDCTLKLRTAGYLKCTTNTVKTGPRCQVECQRYAEKAATSKTVHECDVTGRWNPPLPHCVEREGIDVVNPPPNMYLADVNYPQ